MTVIPLRNREERRRVKYNKKNDTLTLEQFIELMRCPKQRDENGRSKKKGIRRKFKILLPEHTHVIGAILLCDVIDEKKERRIAGDLSGTGAFNKYIVQKGDSIRAIAESFKVSRTEILEVNLIDEGHPLVSGRILRIPKPKFLEYV